MGARNVSAAYAMWGHLPHGAFRLLTGMALQSLDDTGKDGRPPRLWFGGEAAMIELVGRSRGVAYDALAVLKKAGAVAQIDDGRHGHRASFELALDPSKASDLPDPLDGE